MYDNYSCTRTGLSGVCCSVAHLRTQEPGPYWYVLWGISCVEVHSVPPKYGMYFQAANRLLTESSAKADDTTISPVALELAALRMDIELLASQERS